MKFVPWTFGRANWSKDRKTITVTFHLRAGFGVKLKSIETDEEGVFVTAVFEVDEDSPLLDPSQSRKDLT